MHVGYIIIAHYTGMFINLIYSLLASQVASTFGPHVGIICHIWPRYGMAKQI